MIAAIITRLLGALGRQTPDAHALALQKRAVELALREKGYSRREAREAVHAYFSRGADGFGG